MGVYHGCGVRRWYVGSRLPLHFNPQSGWLCCHCFCFNWTSTAPWVHGHTQRSRPTNLKAVLFYYCQWKHWWQRTAWAPVMRALVSPRTLGSSLCTCFQLWILLSCFSRHGIIMRTLLELSFLSTRDLCWLSLVIRVWMLTWCFYWLGELFSFRFLKIFLFHYFLLNWL